MYISYTFLLIPTGARFVPSLLFCVRNDVSVRFRSVVASSSDCGLWEVLNPSQSSSIRVAFVNRLGIKRLHYQTY